MLRTPAPFPQVGSWALLREEGREVAVRITATVPDEAGMLLVSVAGEHTASAVKRRPLAALRNTDALSADEQAELAAIDARMAGKARPKKADVERAHLLGTRHERSKILRALLEKQPEKYNPAAAEAARTMGAAPSARSGQAA